ncbi:MAG: hypothetical protein ACRDKX_00625, partial [Solirubrobacterales bacterium]
MEGSRATWTDERLDDLSRTVETGFARLDADLRAVRTEMGAMRSDLSSRIDAQGADLSSRFDALQRTMLQVGGATIGSVLV